MISAKRSLFLTPRWILTRAPLIRYRLAHPIDRQCHILCFNPSSGWLISVSHYRELRLVHILWWLLWSLDWISMPAIFKHKASNIIYWTDTDIPIHIAQSARAERQCRASWSIDYSAQRSGWRILKAGGLCLGTDRVLWKGKALFATKGTQRSFEYIADCFVGVSIIIQPCTHFGSLLSDVESLQSLQSLTSKDLPSVYLWCVQAYTQTSICRFLCRLNCDAIHQWSLVPSRSLQGEGGALSYNSLNMKHLPLWCLSLLIGRDRDGSRSILH